MGDAMKVQRMMEQLALTLAEEYSEFLEGYDPRFLGSEVYMTVQAYIRARILNELEFATQYAVQYAETNGGL